MELYETAERVAAQLSDAGHIAYFAGGCVRDRLLGRTPHDIDIATSAHPDEILRLFPKAKMVGAHFGVALVREKGHQIEIATFREDGSYGDGRHPDSVRFAGPEEDAKRRDFTVNGLFEEPQSGKIIDLVGGQADVEAGILRAIGDPAERFGEDHLRMLRAIRFTAQLGFEIEPATWTTLCAGADDLQRISIERIQEEFTKILLSPGRALGFDLLTNSGLMRHIIPEIYDLQGCEQPPQFHPEGDVYTHTHLMLSLLPEEVSLQVALSVVLHDIGKPRTQTRDEADGRIRFNNHDRVGAAMAEQILRRLRYSNAVTEATVEAVDQHMKFLSAQQMRTATLKRFMGRPHFEEEMQLHRVDCLASNGNLETHSFLKGKIEEFAAEPILPEPFLTGRDLLERGWPKNHQIGETLTEAFNLQLEGTHPDRALALQWLDSQRAELGTPDQ